MISFLIITAITVSLDSFICGFSLSYLSNKKTPIVIGIALTVFAMCLVTNYATLLFSNFITEKTTCLGGLILIAIGIINLLNKEKDQKHITTDKSLFKQILCISFAVGLDGSLANLSLSLMGLNAFYVPVTIAITHAIMIWLGILLSQTSTGKKLEKIECISPLILILLGGYKLLGLFI